MREPAVPCESDELFSFLTLDGTTRDVVLAGKGGEGYMFEVLATDARGSLRSARALKLSSADIFVARSEALHCWSAVLRFNVAQFDTEADRTSPKLERTPGRRRPKWATSKRE